jgi:hypothetical protein
MSELQAAGHWATLFYGEGGMKAIFSGQDGMKSLRFNFLPRPGDSVAFKDSVGRHVAVRVDQVHFAEDEDGEVLVSLICQRTNEEASSAPIASDKAS